MTDSAIIPLFPLSIVVFPGHLVPLHIFEERYKKMIDDCAGPGGRYRPFGISLEQDGEVSGIGCAVVVQRRAEPGANGSFDIVCRARQRYRTLEVLTDEDYLQGRVEFFDDDDDDGADPALQALVKTRFRELVDLAAREAGAQIVDGKGVEEEAAQGIEEGNAWAIAQRMGMEPPRKQHLLEMTTENARLQLLAEYLEELLPVLEARMARKTRSKSNGHSHDI
jgi:Lon protease-like protein